MTPKNPPPPRLAVCPWCRQPPQRLAGNGGIRIRCITDICPVQPRMREFLPIDQAQQAWNMFWTTR